MANIVIVTDKCYLVCEAINYITINEAEKQERPAHYGRKKRFKTKTKKQRQNDLNTDYNIVIDFIPVKLGPGIVSTSPSNGSYGSSSSGDESTSVAIRIRGYDKSLELFSSMVSQIREQLPDQIFLDKLVEKFLTDNK